MTYYLIALTYGTPTLLLRIKNRHLVRVSRYPEQEHVQVGQTVSPRGEVFSPGLARALHDPPSMMHGAAKESLHKMPLLEIAPWQQPACAKLNRRGVRSSDRLLRGEMYASVWNHPVVDALVRASHFSFSRSKKPNCILR